jgi:hypothetical protein
VFLCHLHEQTRRDHFVSLFACFIVFSSVRFKNKTDHATIVPWTPGKYDVVCSAHNDISRTSASQCLDYYVRCLPVLMCIEQVKTETNLSCLNKKNCLVKLKNVSCVFMSSA